MAARHDLQWHKTNNHTTEVIGRTHGEGIDVGYVYSGALAPWDEKLGEYRAFTDAEKQDELICSFVDLDKYQAEAEPAQAAGDPNAKQRVAKERHDTRRQRQASIAKAAKRSTLNSKPAKELVLNNF